MNEAFLLVEARRRLRGFELDVQLFSDRERTVIFGPSGSGKSMTLRAIAGVERLDAGVIEVCGSTLFDSARGIDLAPRARRVGYVPQGYALFPHMTVEENILYGAPGRGAAGLAPRALLELTGLSGLEKRRPRELSGGQQQRVALARALASEPMLLLLDEPFSALDVALRRQLRDEVIDLQRRTHTPLLAVTHDLQDAFELGERIVVISQGRVLQQGSREDLFYRPVSREVARLVGMRNLLEARVVGPCPEGIVVDWHGHRLEAETPERLAAGERVTLSVRPSQVMVRREEDAEGGHRNTIEGRLIEEVVTPEGYRLKFQPSGSGESIEIELSGYTYFRLGLDRRKEIEVSIRPDALHVIAG
jgi:molybdate transport system ATP-binding protein